MRQLSSLLLLAVLTVLSACTPKAAVVAQSAAPLSSAPAYAPTASDTSLLWRITGPGITGESYLYGTIHIIPAEDYFLANGVISALNDAEEVVFEIDPRQMQDPMAMMGLMSKINMNGETSLEDLLTFEEYTAVESYFNKMGLPFFIFKRMKPLFLSAMIGQDMEALQQGGGMTGGDTKSYELEMTELAKAAGKKISGLETMEFQLSLFDSIPYQAQAQMLYKAVQEEADGTGGGESEMDRLVDMYTRKAVAEMATTISYETAEISRFEELLLTKRNENWVPKIKSLSAIGPRLYAVGAGHLGGEKGVISLLRQEGLRVEAVY
jgi:hypothetical protein